jgi:hypothetical protein
VTWFWFIVGPLVIVLAALTLIDLFKRGQGAWYLALWTLLIVLLPVIGALAYWIARRPTAKDAEAAYLAQADRRRESKQLPIDRSGY